VVYLSGSGHWPVGRLAALLGRLDEAAEHYATAVTVNAKIGARPYVALARLDWADALRSRGRQETWPRRSSWPGRPPRRSASTCRARAAARAS
jgi:hypothetical protein